jgi:hypothetical protein
MKNYILIGLLVVAAIFTMYSMRDSFTLAGPGQTVIQGSIVDGKSGVDSNVQLPASLNQDKGLTFAYSCWVRIDNFAYQPGKQKVIFTKGPADLSLSCPALLIDGNTNSFLVKLDTFGATEIVAIPNIPAKKWMHVVLVVDQKAMDIYINGILHTHHSIAQLPRQNSGTVHTGVDSGFEGKLAGLTYYNYFLKPTDIPALMGTKPQNDSDLGPLPPYFDIGWWIGRSRNV